MHRVLATAVFFIALARVLSAQCGGAGAGIPIIRLNASVVERPTEFEVSNGAPGADWVCFVDTNAGPTTTPFGNLCFSSTAAILFNSYAGTAPKLDADGSARLAVTPPAALAAVEGIEFYMQAIVADPTAPFGVRLSVEESVSFRRARVFVGTAHDLFTTPAQSLVAVEPSSGSIDFRVTPAGPSIRAFKDLIACPEERCIASLDYTGTVRVYEEGTGLHRFVIPASQFVSEIALGYDGRHLLLDRDFDITRVDLTNGSLFSFPAPPGFHIVAHPGRSEVLVVGPGNLLRHDYRTGAALPSIPIPLATTSGTGYTTLIVGQQLFVMTSGAPTAPSMNIELAAIDLDANVVTDTSPIPVGFGKVLSANFAMGAAGPGIWLTTVSEVIEIDPSTLTVRQTIPTPEATTATVSGGGTELLLNGASAVSKLDLTTGSITLVKTVTNNQSPVITATADRAYFVDGGTLYGMATDPTTIALPIVTLYPASQAATGTSIASTRIIAE